MQKIRWWLFWAFLGLLFWCLLGFGVYEISQAKQVEISKKRDPILFTVGKLVEKEKLQVNFSRVGFVSNRFERGVVTKPDKSKLIEKSVRKSK